MSFRVHFTITQKEPAKVIAKGTADYESFGDIVMALHGSCLVSFNVVKIDPVLDTTIIDFQNWS